MFHYIVEYLEKSEEYTLRKDSGLVAANCYGDAANAVVRCYDAICSIQLEERDSLISEEEILECFSKEMEED